jgi:hypothetical protein
VLAQLADALRVSTALMYLRAGLLQDKDGQQSVPGAIAADPDLTVAQKQSLTQIYEAFRRENARGDTGPAAPEPAAPEPTAGAEAAGSPGSATTRRPRRTQTTAGERPRATAGGRVQASSGRGRTTDKEEGRS